MPELQRGHRSNIRQWGNVQVVKPALPLAAGSDPVANLDEGLTALESPFRTAFLHHTDRHEVEAHSRNMEHLLQLDLARLALNDDVEDDGSDARRGHGPLVTHCDAPSRGRLVVVEARAHPAHVCRRRRVDKPRLGNFMVVSRVAKKSDGVVSVATVVSRNRGHLDLALFPGLKHGAIVRDVPELVAVVALDLGGFTTAALTSRVGSYECRVTNALDRR